jgi:hypothetical protein
MKPSIPTPKRSEAMAATTTATVTQRKVHLLTFRGRPIAGLPGGEDWNLPTPRAGRVQRSDYFCGLRSTAWREYIHGFGHTWLYDVKLIVARAEKETLQRRLSGGEGVAPPEKFGGPTGFERAALLRDGR